MDDLNIHLGATDDISPVANDVMRAFDKLREKWEQAADEMSHAGSVVASAQAIEKAFAKSAESIVRGFMRSGDASDELRGRVAKLAIEADKAQQRMDQQEIADAARADAALLRKAEAEAAAEIRVHEQLLATIERLDYQAIDALSRADAARLREVERSAAAEVAARERAAEATGVAAAAAGGAGGGGIGGLLGMIPGPGKILGLVKDVLGGVGSLVKGAFEGAFSIAGTIGSALLLPVQAVTGAFTNITSSIANAGGELGKFLALGAGFYGMHQIVSSLMDAFHGLVDAIITFQDKIVTIAALTKGGAADLKMLSEGALEASMATGRSAEELGQAIFFIESHGYTGADALTVLDKASKLAAGGLGETADLIRIVTGQMVAYGKGAEEAGHYFDVFARTEQLASLPIGELSGQFQRLTPVVAALQIPIEDVGAAVATISQTGLGAGRVITDLGAALQSLIDITPKGRKALDAMGYPIEKLRTDLQQKDGLRQTLTNIWEASKHDVDAIADVFGDGARALVGYLALMEQNGERYQENMELMAQAAGTTEKVWELAQMRVSIQVQRSQNIFKAYGIAITENLLPGISSAWDKINDAFQKGDIRTGVDLAIRGVSDAANSIFTMVNNLATKMFGGGVNIIGQLAKGIMDGARAILGNAIEYVADMIAGFLLGFSPPKYGPLHHIQSGVAAWTKSYAGAMVSNGAQMANAAESVAGSVNEQLAKIGGVQGGSVKGMEAQVANIEAQLLPWEMAAESIKAHYENMLSPLERQIASIERIKNLEYERKQLAFDQRDLALDQLKLQAEGDPVRKAALAGQLARAQFTREGHSLDQQMSSLQRRARQPRAKGQSGAEYAMERRSIADEMAVLNIQRQQHRLSTAALQGQVAQSGSKLDSDKAAAEIQNRSFELQKKMTLQPLIEQRDKIKLQMQTELDYIAQQTQGLNDQKRLLEGQLKLLKDRESAAKGDKAGGGGTPWVMPDVVAAAHGNMEKGIDNIVTTLRSKIEDGFTEFWRVRGAAIGQGAIGFLVGGMVGGLPGAIIGAAFVPKLIAAITARGVTAEDFSKFVESARVSLVEAFTKARTLLTAGDILGTFTSLRDSVSKWIMGFQTALFAEWATIEVKVPSGTKGGPDEMQSVFLKSMIGEPGAVRHTGIGRTIIEAMFEGFTDKELNYQVAGQLINDKIIVPVQKALADQWAKFAVNRTAVMQEGFSSSGPVMMTQAERLGQGIMDMLTSAFNWIKTNLAGPAESLGKTLGDVLVSATTYLTKDESSKAAMSAAFEALGMSVGGSFGKGILKSLWTAGTPIGPAATGMALGAQARGEPTNPLAGPIAGLKQENQPLAGPIAALKDWLTGEGPGSVVQAATDAIGGFVEYVTGSAGKGLMVQAGVDMGQNVMQGLEGSEGLDSGSPSRATARTAIDAIIGFQEPFQSDAITGSVIRMWARNEVLVPITTILVTGEGKGIGGLAGVAIDAIDGMSAVFAQGVSAELASDLQLFGRGIVTGIMTPINDPTTGLRARLRDTYSNLPRPPTPSAPSGVDGEGISAGKGQRYAATGADFQVGGSGGTDSTFTPMWLTPGERVQVSTPGQAGGGASRQYNVSVTINGGDPAEVERVVRSTMTDVLRDQADEVPGEFLGAWRTAKAQGSPGGRPQGVQARGARG